MAITDLDVFAHLTDADIENLGVELDAIRQDIEDSRGERDARYIRRTIAAQRALEVAGRVLLAASSRRSTCRQATHTGRRPCRIRRASHPARQKKQRGRQRRGCPNQREGRYGGRRMRSWRCGLLLQSVAVVGHDCPPKQRQCINLCESERSVPEAIHATAPEKRRSSSRIHLRSERILRRYGSPMTG